MSRPLLTFLLVAAATAAVSASPLASRTTPNHTRQAPQSPPPAPQGACGFVGNQDVYGLGIRIGLYAQWLSTLISNWLHQKTVTKMRDVNTCFQLAMLTALVAISNQQPKPHAIDPYIIIIQIIGSASTITNHATHRSQWNRTTWGGVIRFFVYFSVSAYATWFWWVGIEAMTPTPCGTKAFAFTKTDLWGWFRTVNKWVSIVFTAVFTVLFGYTLWNFGPEFWRRTPMARYVYRRLPESQEPRSETEQGLAEITSGAMVGKWTPALCVLVLVLSVVAIELVIVWNEVKSVSDIFSTGQLIPLVVGVGGLIQVLYKMRDEEVRVHRSSTIARASGVQARDDVAMSGMGRDTAYA